MTNIGCDWEAVVLKNSDDLQSMLFSIDGRGYSAYKGIKGSYVFEKYILSIDHVQADPFASPSKVRIVMDRKVAGIPNEWTDAKAKIIAVSDFLTRAFGKAIRKLHGGGTKTEGKVLIDSCGQEVLERTSVLIREDAIETRFEIGLPAAGRRVLAKKANRLFNQIIPQIAEQALLYRNLDQAALKKQIVLMLDQEYIRQVLKEKQLVAFVADGAILPRESGVSARPLAHAVPFKSPDSLKVWLTLPSGRAISGMGIPKGITLIVGGGFHGKSTLLRALEAGVYNHIPGDGRELVITQADAVKIRAEDGRHIEKVNIGTFIDRLPGDRDTQAFTTENASGSTSQAANVMEALEAGTSLLLIDEDTSATNFMIRDARMQKLVSGDKEPITPFIDKVRPLYREHDVSTILIVGGSGDYFDVADRVIMMDEYVPSEVTAAAKQIAAENGYQRELPPDRTFGNVTPRIPLKTSFSLSGRENRLKPKGKYTIMYGRQIIDISALEQLADDSQTNALAVMIDFARKRILDDRLTLSQATDRLYEWICRFGLDQISSSAAHQGNLALPRKQEFCAALNRYRGLKIRRSI